MTDLDALEISHQVFEHSAVFSVEESRLIKTNMDCLHTKNLFLKDTGGAFFLLTVPADARIDLKRVHPILSCRRLSFGKPEAMDYLIGVAPGSVTPLAMINAEPGTITLVLDKSLTGDELVGVHPLRNTATVTLSGFDILRLANHWGHEPQIAELPTL
jgi:Ala-tRNA(Pro) deacylase